MDPATQSCSGPAAGRLPVATVLRLHAVLGGDPVTEEMILDFIGHRYNARSLIYLPRKVAAEAFRRPADFIRAAKHFCEPALPF